MGCVPKECAHKFLKGISSLSIFEDKRELRISFDEKIIGTNF